MATEETTTDIKTRANLSYILVAGALVMLGYILFRWGDKTEILTLVIGLIGGTILGSVTSVYYGGSSGQPKKPDPTVPVTGDSPVVNVNPPAPDPAP
jgi:hypothetical protein